MRSSIVELIGVSRYSSPAIVITAVISFGRDEIFFAAVRISSRRKDCQKGVFLFEPGLIRHFNLKMEPQFINVNSFSAKYRNKREIYTFLTVDGEVYLPPFETVTVYYLKALIQGDKKCK